MRRAIAGFLVPMFLATTLATPAFARREDDQPPDAPAGTSGQGGIGVGGSIVVQPGAAPTYGPGAYPPPPTYTGQPGGPVVVPNAVPVFVRNDVPGIEHRLSTIDGAVLGSCVGNCTFQVPPGTYFVESGETDTLRSGKKKIVVSGSTLVDVSPGSKSQRTTGLVMGVTGPVLFVVGMVGLLVTAASDAVNELCYDGSRCRDDDPDYTPWVAALVGGVGITTAGWILFGVSGTKIKASPYAGPAPYAPQPAQLALAPVKVRGGGGLGLELRF